MGKVEKLCIKVLEYAKNHKMKISEEEFHEICGKYTDNVLAELHNKKIGTYVSGYKSIWSIKQDLLESALSNYKSQFSSNYIADVIQWLQRLHSQIIKSRGSAIFFASPRSPATK